MNMSKQIAHPGPGPRANGSSGDSLTRAASGARAKATVAPSARAVIWNCALLVPFSKLSPGLSQKNVKNVYLP